MNRRPQAVACQCSRDVASTSPEWLLICLYFGKEDKQATTSLPDRCPKHRSLSHLTHQSTWLSTHNYCRRRNKGLSQGVHSPQWNLVAIGESLHRILKINCSMALTWQFSVVRQNRNWRNCTYNLKYCVRRNWRDSGVDWESSEPSAEDPLPTREGHCMELENERMEMGCPLKVLHQNR